MRDVSRLCWARLWAPLDFTFPLGDFRETLPRTLTRPWTSLPILPGYVFTTGIMPPISLSPTTTEDQASSVSYDSPQVSPIGSSYYHYTMLLYSPVLPLRSYARYLQRIYFNSSAFTLSIFPSTPLPKDPSSYIRLGFNASRWYRRKVPQWFVSSPAP